MFRLTKFSRNHAILLVTYLLFFSFGHGFFRQLFDIRYSPKILSSSLEHLLHGRGWPWVSQICRGCQGFWCGCPLGSVGVLTPTVEYNSPPMNIPNFNTMRPSVPEKWKRVHKWRYTPYLTCAKRVANLRLTTHQIAVPSVRPFPRYGNTGIDLHTCTCARADAPDY